MCPRCHSKRSVGSGVLVVTRSGWMSAPKGHLLSGGALECILPPFSEKKNQTDRKAKGTTSQFDQAVKQATEQACKTRKTEEQIAQRKIHPASSTTNGKEKDHSWRERSKFRGELSADIPSSPSQHLGHASWHHFVQSHTLLDSTR